MRDAAGRHDTLNQRRAKIESAERRKCPSCGRKSALVKTDDPVIRRYCRWCDYNELRRS